MHRYSQGGPCSCGLFHSGQSSCLSMIWPVDEADVYAMPPSSSVDCTLSLGTPSTRLDNTKQQQGHERRGSATCMPMSNFCWDFWQQNNTNAGSKQHISNNINSSKSSHRGGNANANGSDPLLARRCANCDTTSTPLWRNGPRGPKSLCNACGIRFKKEERRATAAAATSTNAAPSAGMMEAHHMSSAAAYYNNSSWTGHQSQKMQCYSPAIGDHHEFRFIEDDDSETGTGSIPFLSWRLNVTDRPSLVHDFTR